MSVPAGEGEPTRAVRSGIGSVADARGRRVALRDPAVDWLVGDRRGMDPATAEAIMHELEGGLRSSRRRVLVGMLGFVVLVVVAVGALVVSIAVEGGAAWRDFVGSLTLTGPAVLLMLCAGVVVPVVLARRSRLARSCEVLLRHGRCPHCGYRIAEVAADPATGHTVCPECGCAWRAPHAPARPDGGKATP